MTNSNEPPQPDGSADEPAPVAPPPSDSPYAANAGGGYGTPPPQAGPPYGEDSGAYSPTAALSYGWRKFSASPTTLLIPMIVVFVGVVITSLIVEFVIVGGFFGSHDCAASTAATATTRCSPSFFRQLLGAGLGAAIITLVTQILAAGLYRGATRVTDGQSFSLGELFEGWSRMQVVYASLFIAVATFIGTVLCYLPGVLISFLTSYTLFFIVDQQMEAAEAIRASVSLVWHHFVQTLVYYLLAVIVLAIGALLCGVGLLVAAPVALIGFAYTYRRLQGQPVVA